MKKMAALFICIILAASVSMVSSGDASSLYESKCAGCHGKDGSKETRGVVLTGLDSVDALKKMQGYLDGSYGGKGKGMMARVLKRFKPEQLKGLADHIGTFK